MLTNWGLIGSLVGLLGICAAIALYQRNQKNNRINIFENSFFQIYKGGGRIIEYLIPAGIVNLKNDREIESALGQLKNRLNMNQHPLRQWNDDIKKRGYKKFFQKVTNGPKALNKNTIQDYINSDYTGFWGGLRYPPKEAEMQRLCNQLS